MKIGLEFDGVIADSHPLKAKMAKEMFGVDINPDHFRKSPVVSGGFLTAEQYKAVQERVYNHYHQMLPVPLAIRYIYQMRRDGHQLSVITRRAGESLALAQGWLKMRINIPMVGVGVGLSKADACKGLDVYVDDDLDKLTPLIGVVPKLLFYSWPYNVHEEEPDEIVRVFSWYDLYYKHVNLVNQ